MNSGGGLPVGSVCLIGQDKYNSYTDIITRCFIAEGIAHKHAIYIADLNEDIEHLTRVIKYIEVLNIKEFYLKNLILNKENTNC